MGQVVQAAPEGRLALPAAVRVPDQWVPRAPLRIELAPMADPAFRLAWTALQPLSPAFLLLRRLPSAAQHSSAVLQLPVGLVRTHVFVLLPVDQLLPELLSAADPLRVWLLLLLLSVARQLVGQHPQLLFGAFLPRLHSAHRLDGGLLLPPVPFLLSVADAMIDHRRVARCYPARG